MDVQRIEQITRAEMAGLRCDSREPGWILYHGQRTGKLAALLAGKLNCQVDCDILYTAGLFHDIGKGNDLHNEVGANLIQLNHGLDQKQELGNYFEMGKKDKDTVVDDYEKLKFEIIRDKVDEIFHNHPKDYIAKLEELGFSYVEDGDDSEELEERNAKPENQRQRDLIDFFENKGKLTKEIFESYSKEKAADNPNYPLFRKYFREANKNLKSLLLYGFDNYPSRIDLLSDLSYFHEFENIIAILISYYTKACVDQQNLDTFTELTQEFYYSTKPDDYEAYYALRELFEPETEKRKIIDFLIFEEEEAQKKSSQPIDF